MHKKSSLTLFIPAAYAAHSTKLEKFLSKKTPEYRNVWTHTGSVWLCAYSYLDWPIYILAFLPRIDRCLTHWQVETHKTRAQRRKVHGKLNFWHVARHNHRLDAQKACLFAAHWSRAPAREFSAPSQPPGPWEKSSAPLPCDKFFLKAREANWFCASTIPVYVFVCSLLAFAIYKFCFVNTSTLSPQVLCKFGKHEKNVYKLIYKGSPTPHTLH